MNTEFWLITGGAAGALFGRLLLRISLTTKKIQSPLKLALLAACCGLALGEMAIYFGPLAVGSGKNTLTHMLFSADPELGPSLPIMRFVGPLISYLAGTAGGIFAPSLALPSLPLCWWWK